MNLRAGDVLLSYKEPPKTWWPPRVWLERFGHWRLRRYCQKLYPHGDIRYDHVRLVCGPVLSDNPDRILGFEFTFPHAGFFWFSADAHHWMYDPNYSKLFRPKDEILDPAFATMSETMRARLLHKACLRWDGTLYDVGQLIDIELGTHGLFDWGRRYKICSVGARIIQESPSILRKPLFPEVEVERTPPCSWANSNKFGAISWPIVAT